MTSIFGEEGERYDVMRGPRAGEEEDASNGPAKGAPEMQMAPMMGIEDGCSKMSESTVAESFG